MLPTHSFFSSFVHAFAAFSTADKRVLALNTHASSLFCHLNCLDPKKNVDDL